MISKRFAILFFAFTLIVACVNVVGATVTIPVSPVSTKVSGGGYWTSKGGSWTYTVTITNINKIYSGDITFLMPCSGNFHFNIHLGNGYPTNLAAVVLINGHPPKGMTLPVIPNPAYGNLDLITGPGVHSIWLKVKQGDVVDINIYNFGDERGTFKASVWDTYVNTNHPSSPNAVGLLPLQELIPTQEKRSTSKTTHTVTKTKTTHTHRSTTHKPSNNAKGPEFGMYGVSNKAFGFPDKYTVKKDSYEPDNTMIQAEFVNSSIMNVGWGTGLHSIYPSTDVDWYKFHIFITPCTVTINTYNSNPKWWKPVDTVLYLYDSNGRLLKWNNDYDSTVYSRIEYTIYKPGWYYVEVASYNHFESGYYGIHFYFNPVQVRRSVVGGAPSSGWGLPSLHLPSLHLPSLHMPNVSVPNPLDMRNWIVEHVLNPLGKGAEYTITTLGKGIVNFVVNPVLGIFKQVFDGISNSISYITQGVENVLKSIFGLSEVADATTSKYLSGSVNIGLPNMQGIENWISQHIVNPLGSAVTNIINTVSKGIVDYIVKPVLSMINDVLSGLKQAVEEIAEGVNNVLKSIFGLGVCAPLMEASMKSAALHIPPIGYMVVGFMIAAFGTGIIAGGIELPPPFDVIADGIGFSLVVLGAIICLYGLAPQMATELFVIGSIVILIIALVKIISYLRRVK